MGANKYGNYDAQMQRDLKERRKEIHPVWRGVGFLLIFITPIMGYFGALALIALNEKSKWFSIPRDFLADGADRLLYVKIGLTIILAFLFYSFLQLITFIVMQSLGPSRYGPYDVPPVRYRGKRHSR